MSEMDFSGTPVVLEKGTIAIDWYNRKLWIRAQEPDMWVSAQDPTIGAIHINDLDMLQGAMGPVQFLPPLIS